MNFFINSRLGVQIIKKKRSHPVIPSLVKLWTKELFTKIVNKKHLLVVKSTYPLYCILLCGVEKVYKKVTNHYKE